MVFREMYLKTVLGVRVTGCVISSWTLFGLVDGKVTGWCFSNLDHQFSSSNQSTVYVFRVSSFHLIGGLVSVRNNLRMCVRHCYLFFSRRTRTL